MTSPTRPTRPIGPPIAPRSALRIALRIALRVALALLVALGVARLAAGWWAGHRRAEAEAAARTAGPPLELEAYLPVLEPGEPNGSDLLNALAYLDRLGGERGQPVERDALRRAEPDAATAAAARAWLEAPANQDLLGSFDRHASARRARYLPAPVAAPGLAARYDAYLDLRLTALRLGRLLATRAQLAGHAGDAAAAWRDAAAGLQVAGWLHQECPGVSPWLLGTGVAARSLTAVETLLLVSPAQASERAAAVSSLDALRLDPGHWLGGERAFALRMVESAGLVPGAGWWWRAASGWWEELAVADLVEGYGVLVEWARLPPHGRPPKEEALGSGSTPWAGLLIPNMLDAVRKGDRLRLRVELARATLSWLATPPAARPPRPALPPDPFSGGTLTWTAEGGVCTAASIDPGDGDGPVSWSLRCGGG